MLFCLLFKHLTNKKKSTSFNFQKENALPFIYGAKKSEWLVSRWLAISNTRKVIIIFLVRWYGFSQSWKSRWSTPVIDDFLVSTPYIVLNSHGKGSGCAYHNYHNGPTWLLSPQNVTRSLSRTERAGACFSKVPILFRVSQFPLYLRNAEVLSHQISQSSWCFFH